MHAFIYRIVAFLMLKNIKPIPEIKEISKTKPPKTAIPSKITSAYRLGRFAALSRKAMVAITPPIKKEMTPRVEKKITQTEQKSNFPSVKSEKELILEKMKMIRKEEEKQKEIRSTFKLVSHAVKPIKKMNSQFYHAYLPLIKEETKGDMSPIPRPKSR